MMAERMEMENKRLKIENEQQKVRILELENRVKNLEAENRRILTNWRKGGFFDNNSLLCCSVLIIQWLLRIKQPKLFGNRVK